MELGAIMVRELGGSSLGSTISKLVRTHRIGIDASNFHLRQHVSDRYR